jgi:hypothetical protein
VCQEDLGEKQDVFGEQFFAEMAGVNWNTRDWIDRLEFDKKEWLNAAMARKRGSSFVYII